MDFTFKVRNTLILCTFTDIRVGIHLLLLLVAVNTSENFQTEEFHIDECLTMPSTV
jgi:hypothetical protein